jgi:hypothetical protein
VENAESADKLMNLMSKHIPSEKLINFADGSILSAEKGEVERHLTQCTSCAKELSLFNKVISTMQADRSPDAPQDSVLWAKNLFRTRVRAPRQTVVQKILAVLQVDLSQMTPAFGERSAAAAAQMLFQAGENSVDLRVSAGEKGLVLKGQILGGGFENCRVSLRAGKKEFKAEANELSEFTIRNIKAGTYEMTLTSAGDDAREITLENLVLK